MNRVEDISLRHHGFYARKRHHGYPSVTCVNTDRHQFNVGDKMIELQGSDTKAMQQRDIDAILLSPNTCDFVICCAAELDRRRKRVANMSAEQIERQRARKRVAGVPLHFFFVATNSVIVIVVIRPVK